MKMIALAVAALAQTASPAVPAGGDDFCGIVRALAASAAEAAPFRSMRAERTQFRLGRLYCFFTSADGYSCAHNLARPTETRESYATRIAACLPGATRSTEQRDHRDLVILRSGRLEARVGEDGDDRAHVGRSIRIFFASVQP